jgi:dTDP-4-amino-4,6-dideoxygalactose transaminase
MSLIALGVTCGDEVITTPFTFFATVESIIRVGATPVFVDIDENTFNMNTKHLEDVVTEKTKAIMPVHLFGQCCNMDDILEFAKKYDLFIIEDSAQAIGAKWNGVLAGSIGTVGCFSFFPSKNLGGFGDGGIVTTNDEELYNKMLRTRQHGIDTKNPYHCEHIGGNFRLDALQAGILNVKLKHIDEWQEARRVNAKYYNERLNGIVTPMESKEAYHVYNQYTIRSDRRDELRKELKESGIGCNVYYPYPIHLQKCISWLKYAEGDLPVCEAMCDEVLALPIFPELTRQEQEYVIKNIK